MSDYGLKVAQDGHDVTESDLNMVFTSKRVSEKVLLQLFGLVQNVNSTADIVFTLDHNLGYVPQFLAFQPTSPFGDYTIIPNYLDGSGVIWSTEAVATSSQVTVTVKFDSGSATPSNASFSTTVLVLDKAM